MQRSLHLRFCLGLLAFAIAIIVAMALPAQAGGLVTEPQPQIEASEGEDPHPTGGAECHAVLCVAAQWNTAVSTLFAVDVPHAALAPAVLPAPDSYQNAADTPPPRV